MVYGFGKLFRKVVHVLTQRFFEKLSTRFKIKSNVLINVFKSKFERLFLYIVLCAC